MPKWSKDAEGEPNNVFVTLGLLMVGGALLVGFIGVMSYHFSPLLIYCVVVLTVIACICIALGVNDIPENEDPEETKMFGKAI